jgi:acyl carrier protein
MGLDAVELVLRTEDEFGITLSDDEAAAATTVGDLYSLVLSKLNVTPGCLTSKAFYLTRRALVESLQIPRRSIRPATPLSPLLPDESRRTQWQQIRERIGLATPPLRIPALLKQDLYKRAFVLSSIAAVVLCITALSQGWKPLAVIFLSCVFWIALTIGSISFLQRLSVPRFATELPADTAGELARVVLSLNYDHFAPPEAAAKPTDEDVWRRLVDIICDQLQVSRDRIVPNARFVDDLDVA